MSNHFFSNLSRFVTENSRAVFGRKEYRFSLNKGTNSHKQLSRKKAKYNELVLDLLHKQPQLQVFDCPTPLKKKRQGGWKSLLQLNVYHGVCPLANDQQLWKNVNLIHQHEVIHLKMMSNKTHIHHLEMKIPHHGTTFLWWEIFSRFGFQGTDASCVGPRTSIRGTKTATLKGRPSQNSHTPWKINHLPTILSG